MMPDDLKRRPDLLLKGVALMLIVFIVIDSIGAYNGLRDGQAKREISEGVLKRQYNPPPSERVPRIIVVTALAIWVWRKSNDDE